MSGSRLILPFNNPENKSLATLVNRAVKEHRGKSRPFVIAVINEDGTATVATNMDRHPQIIELLTEVLHGSKGN